MGFTVGKFDGDPSGLLEGFPGYLNPGLLVFYWWVGSVECLTF